MCIGKVGNRGVGIDGSVRYKGRATAEPFENLLNADLVRTASRHLRPVWPAFDRQRFERLAITGLAQLELEARVQHVVRALEAVLPASFAAVAELCRLASSSFVLLA